MEHQIYVREAEKIQEKKPEEKEETCSLLSLQEINPDVKAWITLEGTHIDYPVLKGITNQTYLHQNLYKEYSLAGSIFIDVRNEPFLDPVTIIYGHHMSNHEMLADLDEYLKEDFFQQHTKGTLWTNEGKKTLETKAVLTVNADDEMIYDPLNHKDSAAFYQYIKEKSVNLDKTFSDNSSKYILLSTCSPKNERERVVLLVEILE